MKNVVKNIVPDRLGTILTVDNGTEVLVPMSTYFFRIGVEITYTVLKKEDRFSVAEIEHINYAPAIRNICLLEGLAEKEIRAVEVAYISAKGKRKLFKESLPQLSEDNLKDFEKLFFGYSFLKYNFSKVERYETTLEELDLPLASIEEVFWKYGFGVFNRLLENPYACTGEKFNFRHADEIYFEVSDREYKRDEIFIPALAEALRKEGSTILSMKETISFCDKNGIFYHTALVDAIMEYYHKKRLYDEDILQNWEIAAFKDKTAAEKRLAALIKRRQRGYLVPQEKIERFKSVLKKEGVNLSSGQEIALNIAGCTGLQCLTGGPGTGKTTVVKNILRVIEDNIPNTVVKLAAPTGKAAKRLSESSGREAQTIHRLVGVGESSCRYNEKKKLDADVVIIDEASMVDTQLAVRLLEALPEKCLLLFVGDVNQLPPVGAGQVFADVIKSGKIPVYRLYETMRQAEGSVLLSNIFKIRDCLEDLTQKPGEFEDYVFETPGDVTSNFISEAVREYRSRGLMDFQVLLARHDGETGTKLVNQQLQSLLNPNKEGCDLPFVKGDKVILTKNNYKKGYVNGDIGIVVDATINGININIVGGGNIILPREEWQNCELAYAITVHKSQGSEYPCVMLAFQHGDKRMLTRKWFYTAVSRAKITCKIYREKGIYPVGDELRKTILTFCL